MLGEKTITPRGFWRIDFFDRYGYSCSLQESSSATDSCIWLGVNEVDPVVLAQEAASLGVKTKETTGWVSYPIPDKVQFHSRMHLNVAQTKDLIAALQAWVDAQEA